MDSRQQYIRELTTAYQVEDEHAGIVPDGARLRIPMIAMDAEQAAIQSHQPTEIEPEKQRAIDAAKRHQDRVQGFADHFTRQRNLRTLADMNRPATAYDQYCHTLSNQWRAA